MKNLFLILFFLITKQIVLAQAVVNIIPKPSTIIEGKGTLQIDFSFVIQDNERAFTNEIEIFNNQIKETLGGNFFVNSVKKSHKSILLVVNNQLKNAEAYSLIINKKEIKIEGSSTGIFYGLQSLYQLIVANHDSQSNKINLPIVTIEDSPSYSWRGMHLDVCRHFFTKEEVKKYIDYLGMHKLNVFHWHLTEDQGWRIEIKKYPLLTTIGSKRSGTIIGPYSTTAPSDNIPHEGYYTQEDIKEIVAYAKARHITVVPEIEMPGHALAALAAYPDLSCKGGSFQPAITWGVFDDVFCAGNENTYLFLENVLTEVISLFPGKFIHIGGDECPKTRWKECKKCQLKIQENQLKDEHDLQSYFIKRIEKFVNGKGRAIIGWDEILEGGLAPNASVMSWRGTSGGIAAAKEKHSVVMSPGQPCYFDHYQSKEKEKEPLAIGGYNSLEAVYAYVPTPVELTKDEQAYILGAQANVWTEYMPDFKQVEYMIFPRLCALSETLWTPMSQKDYSNFTLRLKKHTRILNSKKINYAKHFLQ